MGIITSSANLIFRQENFLTLQNMQEMEWGGNRKWKWEQHARLR